MEKILVVLQDIKKELQNIKSILEQADFIPEDSDGKCFGTSGKSINKPN